MDRQTIVIAGIPITANIEGVGAFDCFDAAYPNATDLGPAGMVQEMLAFKRMTENKHCLVDVGALFGIFSFVFTARPNTVAYAIEPSPWAFPLLQEHCAMNPMHNVIPVNIFAGNKHGAQIQCGRDWKHVIAQRPTGEQCTVTETTIDYLALSPDCMKIDVEGYECGVIRGAVETIRRCRPLIFLEIHCTDLGNYGETPESLVALLAELGYKLKDYSGNLVDLDNHRGSMTRVVCATD